MSASMSHDEWIHNDRADVWTLEQARMVLGDRYDDFARDLAAGAVPSMLAVMTAGAVRPVAVTAGAIADWLHGRIPAAIYPGRGTSTTEAPSGVPERPMTRETLDNLLWKMDAAAFAWTRAVMDAERAAADDGTHEEWSEASEASDRAHVAYIAARRALAEAITEVSS